MLVSVSTLRPQPSRRPHEQSAAFFCVLLVLLCVVQLFVCPMAAQARSRPSSDSGRATTNGTHPFLVFIDAAHGGADPGAKISPALEEKRVTLELALYLRKRLAGHGISVVMARTTDTDPSLMARAQMANHAQAAACIVLHATASGAGVHLFASSLPQVAPSLAPPWQTAQAEYRGQSDQLMSTMQSTLSATGIPILTAHTYLDPLDEMTCPAVAVELAPMESGSMTRGETLADPHYQTQVVEALVSALLEWQKSAAWTTGSAITNGAPSRATSAQGDSTP